jgi:CheY-like chemotaxis protein
MKNNRKSFHIVIVDDDRDDFFLLQEAFKALGVENQLRHMCDGEHLFKYLTKEGPFMEDKDWFFPELILLDLNMPLIDGKEVLAELKSKSSFMEIPIIVYTTSNNPKDKTACMELGAHSYVIKPDAFSMIIKFARKIYDCLLEGIKE